MPQPREAPYGAWSSPISAANVAQAALGFDDLAVVNGCVYLLERRPSEGGRCAVVRIGDEGAALEVTPESANVRSSVHEYGGGAWTTDGKTLWFSEFSDKQIHRSRLDGSSPAQSDPLTRAPGAFADLSYDAQRQRILAVWERPPREGEQEEVAAIVAIEAESDVPSEITVLVSGSDFYSSPRLSPDGQRLSWITWEHPDMPWDATRLWEAEIRADGTLAEPTLVAGGPNEAVQQPRYGHDGSLYFISDRTGWWNIYRRAQPDDAVGQPLIDRPADFGVPHWIFGQSTYAVAGDTLICAWCEKGLWKLGRAELDRPNDSLRPINIGYTSTGSVHPTPTGAVLIAGSPEFPPQVVELRADDDSVDVLRTSAPPPDPRYLSVGRPIEFATSSDEGPDAGPATAHGFFYPPHNDDYEATPGEKPILLVKSHGGPTAACDNVFSPAIQFWTSRGFGVVDVNYRGSTGFGRRYRNALRSRWGVLDVDDCVNAAEHLAAEGHADPERLAIRGGSAGGYTTLAALTFRDTFKAGASLYGIGDLETLARDTHKFESRYLDSLIGAYPQERERYVERSPIHFAEKLSCPVIFLQGLEDKIVPPNQAEAMVTALESQGVPVAYVTYDGEGHGFRKAENIRNALESELSFYAQIFSFEPADDIPPVILRHPS